MVSVHDSMAIDTMESNTQREHTLQDEVHAPMKISTCGKAMLPLFLAYFTMAALVASV